MGESGTAPLVGMYTSIVMELTLQGEVLDFFEWWCNWPRESCPGFPSHRLFEECDAEDDDPAVTGLMRWYGLLWSHSSYFGHDDFGDDRPHFTRSGEIATLRSSASIKNSCGSIEAFMDWITPYVREGYVVSRYEESNTEIGFVYADGKRRPVSRDLEAPWG